MSQRILIRNTCVVSMDPDLGTLESGDILFEKGVIRAVGTNIQAEDAEVIDGSDTLTIPGLIDTHRHLSHTPLRTTGADDTNFTYIVHFVLGYLAAYRAQDVYIGTLAGALEALDAGVTTVVDFADCMLTPAHADEAVRAHQEAGIRSVLCYGLQGGLKHGLEPSGSLDDLFVAPEDLFPDARRVREQKLPADDGLVTMGLSASEVEGLPIERVMRQIALGRELGLKTITMHAAVGNLSGDNHLMLDLALADFLGPDLLISHGNGLLDSELAWMAKTGAAIAVSPENEMSDGFPSILGRALEKGVTISLGADSVTYVSGDLFRQMRYALHYERGQTGRDYAARGLVMSSMAFPTGLGLELATMGGAQALGLDHLIGSITPGKQADMVMVRRDRLSLSPLLDPAKTLVMMAGAGDVDSVFVAGKPVKRHGRLIRKDLPYLLNDLAASRDHLQRAVDAMDVARARSIATQLFPVE